MKISTRGRYALRLMIDLAQNKEQGNISLKDVAKRQEISIKYLEQIATPLIRAGLIKSVRGAQGGYSLTRDINKYTAKELKEELKLSKYVFQRAIKELSNTDLIVITGNGRGRAYSKSLTKLELYVGVQKLADRLRMGN